MEGRCEISLKLFMDIECVASDWREGRSVSNFTARSVQQVVEDVSPDVTYTLPPMKRLKMQGRFFNTTARLVREIFMKYMFVDFLTGQMTLWVPNNQVHKL